MLLALHVDESITIIGMSHTYVHATHITYVLSCSEIIICEHWAHWLPSGSAHALVGNNVLLYSGQVITVVCVR